MLIFVALAWTVIMARQAKAENAGGENSMLAVVKKTFPMFILGFVIMAWLNTFGVFGFQVAGKAVGKWLSQAAKFLFASALAGVGFKIKFADVFSKGSKPIALGGITWLCVAASSMIFIHLFAGYVG